MASIRVVLSGLPEILHDILVRILTADAGFRVSRAETDALIGLVTARRADVVIGGWVEDQEANLTKELIRLDPNIVVVTVPGRTPGFCFFTSRHQHVLPGDISPDELLAEVRRLCC